MSHYIIVQYSYQAVDIAICQKSSILQSVSLHKFQAVAQTIPTIQQLLIFQGISMSDIDYIGVNVGPGPYNTLRALLTMVNGIHKTLNIKIIASNALDLMTIEQNSHDHIIMLQAFEGHLYFNLYLNGVAQSGGASVDDIAAKINALPHPIHAYGNGAQKYQSLFQTLCPDQLIINPDIPAFNSLQTLAAQIFTKYVHNKFHHGYVQPMYFDDMAQAMTKE